ncbi:conserved hypothetical protein [Neospora caninum Liverpool]|uniref:RAP domain-containing protein n=1 Tax=Neospora caninum (strain Liverpool) TaxID=572307 RepID=F0VDE6_NEOCL|nr:conserved hypothetical protein [Neospora caninum Liverpool]CBZ51661.1 conserved hypothetical protein [Neospora caninum Liverpool]CEL65615.1 TPA: RAP domain-containing protein [Neospora caninum Liverpool]|eukprot:XP_003881694.1 conserved hypothetical protein [Neospora caninum Liverpool]
MARTAASVVLGFRRSSVVCRRVSSAASPSPLLPSPTPSSSPSSLSSFPQSFFSASPSPSSSSSSSSARLLGASVVWGRRCLATHATSPSAFVASLPSLPFPSLSAPVGKGDGRPHVATFRLAAAFSTTPSTLPSPAESAQPGEKAERDQKPLDLPLLFDGGEERLSPQQVTEKEQLIKELTQRLSGPLADADGNVPTGAARPIAIEVDGPTHFYANSTRYTAYTKLKHRLLTRMGYKVLHVPYFEWRRLRGQKEREEYMRRKLMEEPTEWLDPEDEKFYNERMKVLKQQYEEEARRAAGLDPVKPEGESAASAPLASQPSQVPPDSRVASFEGGPAGPKSERNPAKASRAGERRERSRENPESRPQYSHPHGHPPHGHPSPGHPHGLPASPYPSFGSPGQDGAPPPFRPPSRPPPFPSSPGQSPPWQPAFRPYAVPHAPPPYAQAPTFQPSHAPHAPASHLQAPPHPLPSPATAAPPVPEAASVEDTIAQIKQKQDELAKMLAQLKSLEAEVGKKEGASSASQGPEEGEVFAGRHGQR